MMSEKHDAETTQLRDGLEGDLTLVRSSGTFNLPAR